MTNQNVNLFRAARAIDAALGAWLFLSAFLWQHTTEQLWNSLIVGALVVAAALGALRAPRLRFANTLAAAWLSLSTWALPTVSEITTWHNSIVAVGIFLLSLLPTQRPAGPPERGGPVEA